MPLVRSKDLLIHARQNRYAVGAFNVFNMESVKAIIQAAESEKSPAIIQVWSGLDAFIGLDVLGSIVKCEAEKSSVPIVLHLDHGLEVKHIVRALRFQYTSVMIDGSSLPLEQNIVLTKRIIQMARAVGIPVEAEIGHVGGEEGGSEKPGELVETDLSEAVAFYEETGVDSLAVSIGTSHGKYTNTPHLNLTLLAELYRRIPVPFVLHGSSYTPEEMIAEAIHLGIAKINVATELNDAIIEKITNDILGGFKSTYVSELTYGGYARMEEIVRHKMRLFQSSGMAR